ncbi:NAD(P)-dependent dehydrogenase (short-subunit alcohol dehydrogenase family) [Bradyrhizobium sp. LM6.10]
MGRTSWSTIPTARRQLKSAALRAAAEVVVLQGDVSRDQDCRKFVYAATPWGRLNLLINNAGTTKHVPNGDLDGPLGGGSSAHLCRQYEGTISDDRAARSLLNGGAKGERTTSRRGERLLDRRHQRRRLIHRVLSEQGRGNAVTPALARGLAPSIRVNTVCRGDIDTQSFTKGAMEPGTRQVRDAALAQMRLRSSRQRRMSRSLSASSQVQRRAT